MHRRTLLGMAATLLPLGLAGCAGGGDSGDGETPGTPSPTSMSTPTPTPPAIEEATLSTRDIVSGQEVDEATVTVEDDAVVVTGTIWGSDGCKTATLDAAEYDVGADTLSVAIATRDRGDAGDACTEALVEIDYRVRVTFSGGLPGTVAVTHDGRAVTTAATAGE